MFDLFILFLLSFFVIIGIVLGNIIKNKYRDFVFNMFFGFLLIITITNLLPNCYYLLSNNYHNTTFIYLLLMMVVGFILVEIIDGFCSNNKNYDFVIMIIFYNFVLGFNLFYNFSFIFILFNCLYNIIIGFYISNLIDNKKMLCVLLFIFNIIGYFVGSLLGDIVPKWIFGLLFSVNIGIVISYISYLMKTIFSVRSSKSSMIGLIIGMFLVLIGVLV